MDYCGPFLIKEKRHRNRKQIKAYVAVLVCLATKAVHLEMVSDLSSEAFIAALRRFTSRCGMCSYIIRTMPQISPGRIVPSRSSESYSDLKTTKGKLLIFCRKDQSSGISHYQGHHTSEVSGGIGGSSEIVQTPSQTNSIHRDLCTKTFILWSEIEAILNSRPFTPISSDPNDLFVITSGHLLIGNSLTSLPELDFSKITSNRLSTWQHIQKIKQHFWTRWHLNELSYALSGRAVNTQSRREHWS